MNEKSELRLLPAADAISRKAKAFAAYFGFIKWAEKYGYELRDTPRHAEGISDRYPSFLGLSAPMSASFNFSYDPADQSVYIAVEQEEFEWLPWLAIEEVVIGNGMIYILTQQIDLAKGEFLPPVALQIWTNQPKVWRAFPGARDIGFMCIQCASGDYTVHEVAPVRFPVRYLQ